MLWNFDRWAGFNPAGSTFLGFEAHYSHYRSDSDLAPGGAIDIDVIDIDAETASLMGWDLVREP